MRLDQCRARPAADERPKTQACTTSRSAMMPNTAATDIQMPARKPSVILLAISAFASRISFCIRSARSDTTLEKASDIDGFGYSGMALLPPGLVLIVWLDRRR